METKTVIVYMSTHHGKTKKLLEASAEKYDVDLADVTENETCDLSGYNCIGIA